MADSIKIVQLYAKELNVYGDDGNVLALVQRLKWRSLEAAVIKHEAGDPLDFTPDIIIGGGGQDSNQSVIKDDFLKIAPKLKDWIEAGVPTLLVCGSYQMFGQYFQNCCVNCFEYLY